MYVGVIGVVIFYGVGVFIVWVVFYSVVFCWCIFGCIDWIKVVFECFTNVVGVGIVVFIFVVGDVIVWWFLIGVNFIVFEGDIGFFGYIIGFCLIWYFVVGVGVHGYVFLVDIFCFWIVVIVVCVCNVIVEFFLDYVGFG